MVFFFSRRILRPLAALAFASAALLGCNGETESEPKEVCEGVVINGVCTAKCEDSKCGATGRCLVPPDFAAGRCFAMCAGNDTCNEGDECSAQTTSSGMAGTFCYPRAYLNKKAGISGDACASDDECDGGHGLGCIDGKCAIKATCAKNADCPKGFVIAGVAQGTYCDGAICRPNGLAVDAGLRGSACGGDAECDKNRNLTCQNGKCEQVPAAEGARCSDDLSCDVLKGFDCVGGKCAKVVALRDEPCGAVPCVQGSVCFNGTCSAPVVGEGKGCDAAAVKCANGLVCDAGVCKKGPAGSGQPCEKEIGCDPSKDGLACIEGVCRYTCKEVTGCADGFECRSFASEGVGACVASTAPTGPGQYGTSCPNPDSCDAKSGFSCVGLAGDINSFCTKKDGCTTDDECPAGFWCSSLRVDLKTQARACVKREFCAPCETDVDCSYQVGAICVSTEQSGGEKFCSVPCAKDSLSCIIGAHCQPTQDGRDACVPRTGYCHAPSNPTACDPCRNDTDCGEKGLCLSGEIGYKPGLSWCAAPCGPPDASGKATCPTAPNGLETVCLDDTYYTGDPENPPSKSDLYQYCIAPTSNDNRSAVIKSGSLSGCGNAQREGTEECDDVNTQSADGCLDCKVLDWCHYTAGDDNDDSNPTLTQPGKSPVTEVLGKCRNFIVEGAIEAAGDVDVIKFTLPESQTAYVEVFTDTIGTCSADLKAEIRNGKVDTAVTCEKLSPQIFDCNGIYGCGDCKNASICGACDDDSGLGTCPRIVANTYPAQYGVKFDTEKKTLRIYARDAGATLGKYVVVVNRLPVDSSLPDPAPYDLSNICF